jgi:hypothetical protein
MSSCYKTLEQYNSPCPVSFPELGRNCTHSNCPSLNSTGYYNISNTRGICNSDGCSVQTPFVEKFAQMRPAAVRGTWDQVKGLYELNPQGHSCVNLPYRENYHKKPTVTVLSADSWCGYSKKMSAQEKEITTALEATGFNVDFVNDSKDKAKFDELAKKHNIKGFPATIVAGKTIPGFMPPEKLVEKVKNI